jgi:hypothetical protein
MAKVAKFFPDNYTQFNNMEIEMELEDTSNFFPREMWSIEISSHNISYNNLYFDIMNTSPYILNILSNHFDIKWSGKFVPDYIVTNIIGNNTMERHAMLKTFNLVYQSKQNKIMIEKFLHEFKEFSGMNWQKDYHMSINNEINRKFIYSMDHILLMVNPEMNVLILNDIIIGMPNNIKEEEFFIMTPNMFYISINGIVGKYVLSSKESISKELVPKVYDILQGFLIGDGKIQNITVQSDEYNNFTMNYKYSNKKNSTYVTYHNKINNSGDIMEIYCKNKLFIARNYNNTTKKDKLISQCMMDGENGIRFRGKYVEEKQNGNIVKKELLKDNDTIYQKENDIVLINKMENVRIKDHIMIGWKVGKSANGENRIIKLMIPTDALIVQPIDMEYFSTKGKQRCNKAIVMDIQFPDEGEEISIVPHEMVAYSSIYNNVNNFEYKVGKEVVPDRFDTNAEVSCTNGIHFYTNRHYVFDVYINRK